MAGSNIKADLIAAENAVKSGDVARAVALYRGILIKAPKHSKAKKALAKLQRQGGNAGAQMTQADAQHLLGVLNSGNIEGAHHLASQMSTAFPNEPFVFNILGYTSGLIGDDKSAVAAYKWAVKLNPNFVEALSNYGSYLVEKERLKEAVDVLRKAVLKKPDYAEAHHNLGVALAAQDQFELALSHYDKAISINPQYANAYNSRGSLQKALQNLPAAIADFEAALRIAPNDRDILENTATALENAGRIQDAVAITTKLVSMFPNDVALRAQLGTQLNTLGRNKEAVVEFNKVLEVDPTHADIMMSMIRMPDLPERENLAGRMEVLSKDPSLEGADKARLCFGLGAYFEEKAQYEKSFAYLKDANKSYRDVLPPPPITDDQRFDRTQRLFGNGPLTHLSTASNPSNRPIFVLGLMRSGTSLVEQIIASHSQVFGAGELNAATDLATPLVMQKGRISGNQLIDFSDRYLNMLKLCDPNAPHVVDKMPGNFFNIGLLKTAFPNAKFVNLVRDPRDTCFSIYKNFFDTFSHQYAYDQVELAKFANRYKRLMNLWDDLFPEAVYNIKYEDLVADQEGESRRLLEYLDLPWQSEVLEFHKNKRAVRTASVNQVRQKIYKSSVKSWRNYESHLQPLVSGLDDEMWNDAYVD